jgi:dihydrofolate reductase
MALDGVVEPDETWHFPYFDDNMGAAVSEDYDAADTLLLGRVTYDSFAGADAVAALRADTATKGVLIPGSISVVRQLLAAGLLDELRLLVHPVAARHGLRLFDEGDSVYALKLLRSETYPTGVVRLVYAPKAPPSGTTTYEDVREHVPQAR